MNAILAYIEKNPNKSFAVALLLMFCYQCLNIFFGFDVLDSGYHLTCYDNIFDAPESVYGNFGYYLSNIIGGAIMQLYPSVGILEYRLLGAFMVLAAISIIFYSLKNEIPAIHLLIGSVSVVVCYTKLPYFFFNGILSCFLYVCAIILLYKGIVNKNSWIVLASGILVGINVFSRMPNILAIGLIFIVLFAHFFSEASLKLNWADAASFFFGIGIGILMVVLLMCILGHVDLIANKIVQLQKAASSSDNSHSLPNLVIGQLYSYYHGFMAIIVFSFLFFFSNKLLQRSFLCIFLKVIVFLWLFYYIYTMESAVTPLWGLSLAGCLVVIFLKRKGHLALLAALGLFVLIVEPVGSNSAFIHGGLPALIAAPVASSVIINRKNFIFVVVVYLAIFVNMLKQGCFFDFGPLTQKTQVIEAPECAGILTTPQRASAINLTLRELKKYVSPEDTLMVYSETPMLNYLTHTRPVGGNPWPMLSNNYLDRINTTSMVLFQKYDALGDWNVQTHFLSLDRKILDDTKVKNINDILVKYNYHVVFENQYYILLSPSSKK